jgi:glycosyltransferase involved in cell wall biosynthesis
MIKDNIPILSIIIPAYNAEWFIADTLSMFIYQGLDQCEIIVVNDGSTDKTGEICLQFEQNHTAIHLLTIQNSGVSVARNTGLSKARGKYIWFFDSDDVIAPNILTLFLETVKNGKNDIFAFGYKTQHNKRDLKKYQYKKYSGQVIAGESWLKLFLSKKVSCLIPSVIFSGKFLQNNALSFTPGIRIGEDVEFLVKAFAYAGSVSYNQQLCFIYQIRNDSVSEGYKILRLERCNVIPMLLGCFEIIYSGNIGGEAYLYLANLYILLLLYYLRSKSYSVDINNFFIKNRYLLCKKISGNYRRVLIIKLVKLLPVKLIFLFKKIF